MDNQDDDFVLTDSEVWRNGKLQDIRCNLISPDAKYFEKMMMVKLCATLMKKWSYNITFINMIVILLFHVLSRACTTFLRSATRGHWWEDACPKKFHPPKKVLLVQQSSTGPKKINWPKKSLTGPKRTWNIFLHSWHMNWFSLLCVLKWTLSAYECVNTWGN